jgi:osmotically-inducible protein OsmY
MKAMRNSLTQFGALLLAGALLGLPQISLGAPGRSEPIAQGQENNSLESAAMAKLKKSQFKDVKASVDSNGIATLTGTVNLYEYKMDAQKRVNGAKGVKAVRNEIEVAGPNVSDEQLKQKLGEALAYDRVGYGNVFNAITLQVQNGM